MDHSFKIGDLVKVITLSDLGVIDRQKVLNPNAFFTVVDADPGGVALRLPRVAGHRKTSQIWWLYRTEVRLYKRVKLEYKTFNWG